MFTGLVEEMGRVIDVTERPSGRHMTIGARAALEGLRTGDSVSVSGCCLTAVEVGVDRFHVEVVHETLTRTTLGEWRPGDAVNLERAMRLDQRLGGHLVQGHVDGVGVIETVTDEGDGKRVALTVPPEIARFIAEKGSLAIDGVSLTVAHVQGARCEVALIPHTLAVTTAGGYAAGRRVNLEVDLIARYLARWLEDAGVGRRNG